MRNGDARDARDAIVILVTDGQVGNEDQLLRELSGDLQRVRVHTVGIDQAVNAGFLGRLASVGGGRCELVESEDRLDEAMDAIHRRIGAPLAYSLALRAEGLATIEDTASPARLPDLFPGVPLVVTGRYRGSATGSLVLHGTTRRRRRLVVDRLRTAPRGPGSDRSVGASPTCVTSRTATPRLTRRTWRSESSTRRCGLVCCAGSPHTSPLTSGPVGSLPRVGCSTA